MRASEVAWDFPSRGTLTSLTLRMYSAGVSRANSSSRPINEGHPPRQHHRAMSAMLVGRRAPASKPASKRREKLTPPPLSPDSLSAIGLIRTRAMRPVPLWRMASVSFGAEDPVRMSWPRLFAFASIRFLEASQIWGTSCHSSTRWGSAPSSTSAGSVRAAARVAGSMSVSTLREWASAVQVFPHHFGPVISTPPKARSIFSTRASTTRAR